MRRKPITEARSVGRPDACDPRAIERADGARAIEARVDVREDESQRTKKNATPWLRVSADFWTPNDPVA
jgi:hypothetical protein